MQVYILFALCSFFLLGVACGKQDNAAPPESSSETQIQEIEGPGIEPHFDGPEILRGGDVVIEEGNDPTLDEALE